MEEDKSDLEKAFKKEICKLGFKKHSHNHLARIIHGSTTELYEKIHGEEGILKKMEELPDFEKSASFLGPKITVKVYLQNMSMIREIECEGFGKNCKYLYRGVGLRRPCSGCMYRIENPGYKAQEEK